MIPIRACHVWFFSVLCRVKGQPLFTLYAKIFQNHSAFHEIPKGTHYRPNAWKQENFCRADFPVAGDVHFLLHVEGFLSQRRLAAAEGVHQEFVDACLEERIQPLVNYAESASKVEGELRGVPTEAGLTEELAYRCSSSVTLRQRRGGSL